MRSQHVGIGGPNIPPPDDGRVAECVAHAPGGPTHVLLSDRRGRAHPRLQHGLPQGRASRRSADSIPQFRIAGDDVDICWQLQDQGGTDRLQRRRASSGTTAATRSRLLRKQQYEYGKAEALLERKWPERYNASATSPGAAGSTGTGATPGRLAALAHLLRDAGARASSSPSISVRAALSRRLRSYLSGSW